VHYLVDGYNLLFVWERTGAGPRGSLEHKRAALVTLLNRFSEATDTAVALVFDGACEIQWGDRSLQRGRIEVVYSDHRGEADDVIIERIRGSTAGRHLAVVSDDRAIRNAAGRRHVTSVRCEAFLRQVARAFETSVPEEPEEKLHGLTDGQAREWMRIMGFTDQGEDDEDGEGR